MKITHTESLIAAPQDGKPGPPGPPGGDAVSVIVSTDNIVFKKNGSLQTVFVDVKVMDGEVPVPYGSGGDDGFICSSLKVPEGLGWSFLTNADHTFAYVIKLKADCIVNAEIPFKVTYRNQIYAHSLFISTVENGNDGLPGEKGAAPRGPQDWDEIPYGYHFMSGAKGERFYDVVLYKGTFWECKETHEKSSVNFPGNQNENYKNFWQRDTFFSIVCTKLLLANYALIRNLGAEAIEMKDADGNVIFQAKDGMVECNTGKFNNVIIDGTIHGKDGYFSGLLKRKMNEINESNIGLYADVVAEDERKCYINFDKIGTLVKLTQSPLSIVCKPWKWLFCGYESDKRTTPEKNRFTYEKALEYVGCSIIFFVEGSPCVPSIGGNIRYTGYTRYNDEKGDEQRVYYDYADIDDIKDPGAWNMLWEDFVYIFTCEFDKKPIRSSNKVDVIWHCKQLGRKF